MQNRTLKDDIADYWTARAASFDSSPGHGITPAAEQEAWAALLAARVGVLAGRRVLELAPGTGEFTGLLLQGGAEVVGLDLSEGMLARARAKHAGQSRAHLLLGDAEDTREAPGSFDAVVCRHLVWTLPAPARAFADWFRVLRPGGRLLVVDGDWVRLPVLARLRRGAGNALCRTLDPQPDPVDWAAHERIMGRVHFRDGLRPAPLATLLREAGFVAVEHGNLAAVHRAQRRAAGFPRSLLVGVWRDFWMTAAKPA